MESSVLMALHEQLQWPEPNHVFNPPGAGPAVFCKLARLKIENPLLRMNFVLSCSEGWSESESF